MFRVGDLVTGKSRNGYGITNEYSLCIVKELLIDEYMEVEVVMHDEGKKCIDRVNPDYFVLCTYEDFINKCPFADFVNGWSLEKLKEVTNTPIEMEIKKMETVMDKEKIGGYTLTDKERESLRKEIIELLEKYDYHPTEYGVNTILDEWVANKGWMINLFKKHPNYNGKFQIAFDSDYQRVCDKIMINNFVTYIRRVAKNALYEEKKIDVFSYSECRNNLRKLNDVLDYLDVLKDRGYKNIILNGRTIQEISDERDRWSKKYNRYRCSGEVQVINGISYDKKKIELYEKLYEVSEQIYYYRSHIADEEFASKINHYIPEIKAVAGQKVSRIVNKICKFIGIDKETDYNREFAKYSDAINPLSIKRHTILSCHPVDYLTMSFGNSWASCHTIDKNNKRGMPDNYSGCYSSGTLSYMLDESSFVYYTVDKDYNGNEYELQNKINRNMFHMGEDKLIQARVYPQATDGETGIYTQIREIAQKVIADCLEVPNMWINSKGTDACRRVIDTYGTHYKDYTNFSDCNVSYLKYDEDNTYKNMEVIKVGHDPICPNCGERHTEESTIECDDCYSDEKRCVSCGNHYDAEDMHYIDGDWYCEDCCFYCQYHGEWEIGNEEDYTYIEDYGRVCEDALDSDDFYQCEECGYWYRENYRNAIVAEDGTHFCGQRCVERSNYTYTHDGSLYPSDEVYFCEHCERDVHRDEWNHDLECCTDCEDEVKEENENSEENEELVEAV